MSHNYQTTITLSKREQDNGSGTDSSDAFQKLDRILSILRRQYVRLRRRRRLLLLSVPLAVIMLGATLLFYAESFSYLSAAVKLGSWIAIVGIATVIYWSLRQWSDLPDFKEFYRSLTYQTDLPKLQHAIDLQQHGRHQESVFHRPAIERNVSDVEESDLQMRSERYIRSQPEATYSRYGLIGFLLSTAVLMLATTSLSGGINRGLQFWHTFQKPNPYTFTVTPGHKTVEQGASVAPQITFAGETMPGQVMLGIKTDIESSYRFRPMRSQGKKQYVTPPIQLTTDARYFIKMDGYRSKVYKLNVQLRPRFSKMRAIIRPPNYTGLDSTHRLYPFSRIEAYPGSRLTLQATTNKSLKHLQILHRRGSTDTTAATRVAATTYRHQFTVGGPDTLSFSMRDSSGLTNDNPFRFTIKPRVDQRPFVELLQPDSSLTIKNPDSLRLVYEGGDDFGLTQAELHFELNRAFADKPVRKSISIPLPRSKQQQAYTWDLTGLDLKPRDHITYWISVTDNDAISGYKTARSRKLTLTVPSMVEYAEKLEKQESRVEKTIEDVSDSYKKMSREYEQFKQQLRRNPTGGWKEQQKLKKVQEKQKKLQEKVEKLNRRFKKMRKELEKNDMLSKDTRQAYKELQDLMKKIDNPDLKKALRKLQKAVKGMNKNQLEKALKNYEFNEQSYKEQLNRTIELFRKLKLNSELEQLSKSLKSLSQEEKQLSKSSSSPSEKIQKQKAVKQDLKQLESRIDSLSEQAPQDARQQMRQLEKQARSQMKSLQKKLNQNISEMKQSGNSKKSRQQQRKMQQQMQKMAGNMQQSQRQMNKKRMKVNISALQRILYSLVNLSEMQEELTRETGELEEGSQAFVEMARRQKNIERQFSQLADSLSAVASDIPMFSSAVTRKKHQLQRRIDRAVTVLDERDKSNAVMAERQILAGVNELSSMVATLLEKLKNRGRGGSGSGSKMTMQQMINQIKKMSGKQQKLNKMMQQMINRMQGNRLSKNQIKRMKQMARQQNQIRKQLQKMRKQGGLEPGDKLLSEMQRLNEKMEQTIRDLRGGQRDRKLLRRQKNILSRMLNARDALNKRDKSKKRKARQPEKTYQQTSPEITMEELQKRVRQQLQDPDYTRFSSDYQQLIETYFELLKEQKSGVRQ